MNRREVLQSLANEARRGELVFPSSVAVAMRIRQALDDPVCHVDAAAKLLQAEPLLAARVVAMANSVAYNRSGNEITDVRTAVSRLGFGSVRALAMALVTRQMAGAPKVTAHRQMAEQLWKHTAHVAALSRLLAQRVTRQNPETALFVGLLHEVGSFYLISRANDRPVLAAAGEVADGDDEIEAAISAAIVDKLSLPASVIDALRVVWSGYLALPPVTLGDTVLLANHLAPVPSPFRLVPEWRNKTQAALVDVVVGQQTLVEILRDSSAEVASLTQALLF